MQLFSYSVTAPDLGAFCHACAAYQNHLQVLCNGFSKFAAVFGDILEIYDLRSEESREYVITENFGEGGSYIELDSNTLLCLGASPPSTAVYELDLPAFTLTSLAPLQTPREGAGVARTANFVYVFGGYDDSLSPLRSCEKLSLRERQWLAMGSMQYGRCYFTPCTFRALIYLSCPLTTTMESFDPQTEIYQALPVCLPSKLEGASASFVVNGELFVLTDNKQLARWRIESETEVRLFVLNKGCCSTQPPLVLDSLVIIANACHESVEKFSLEDYSIA